MRHLAFLLLLLFLCLGCVKTDASHSLDETFPSIKIKPEILDFGKVRPLDNPVHMEFTLENIRNKPLNIVDITSGCGCTVMDVPTEPISAHGKITVPVKVTGPLK